MIFRYVIDAIFFLDILVNFNTAITSDQFEINDNRLDIAISYGKGWFIIDFLAIIPFELVIKLIFDTHNHSTDYNKFIRMSRMSKLFKSISLKPK